MCQSNLLERNNNYKYGPDSRAPKYMKQKNDRTDGKNR